MTNWTAMIEEEMKLHGESWSDVEGQALADGGNLLDEFSSGFGGSEGCAFTIWTKNRVYFPAVYDGSEWAASVPRNPCDEPTGHIGGE